MSITDYEQSENSSEVNIVSSDVLPPWHESIRYYYRNENMLSFHTKQSHIKKHSTNPRIHQSFRTSVSHNTYDKHTLKWHKIPEWYVNDPTDIKLKQLASKKVQKIWKDRNIAKRNSIQTYHNLIAKHSKNLYSPAKNILRQSLEISNNYRTLNMSHKKYKHSRNANSSTTYVRLPTAPSLNRNRNSKTKKYLHNSSETKHFLYIKPSSIFTQIHIESSNTKNPQLVRIGDTITIDIETRIRTHRPRIILWPAKYYRKWENIQQQSNKKTENDCRLKLTSKVLNKQTFNHLLQHSNLYKYVPKQMDIELSVIENAIGSKKWRSTFTVPMNYFMSGLIPFIISVKSLPLQNNQNSKKRNAKCDEFSTNMSTDNSYVIFRANHHCAEYQRNKYQRFSDPIQNKIPMFSNLKSKKLKTKSKKKRKRRKERSKYKRRQRMRRKRKAIAASNRNTMIGRLKLKSNASPYYSQSFLPLRQQQKSKLSKIKSYEQLPPASNRPLPMISAIKQENENLSLKSTVEDVKCLLKEHSILGESMNSSTNKINPTEIQIERKKIEQQLIFLIQNQLKRHGLSPGKSNLTID